MTECIHGLEDQQCDLCFPKKQPENPVVTRSTVPRRAAGARAPRTAGSVARRRPIAEERVYHFTHVNNLNGILDAGGLTVDATPEAPLYSDLGSELRHTAEVAPGSHVDDFVAFSLIPESRAWLEVRAGAHEPGWSQAARRSTPAEYLFFISTVGALGDVVLADGDAAGSLTRFANGTDEVRRMFDRLGDPELQAAAEVLVAGDVPLSSIQLIGVANEPAKERVRSLLAGSGFAPRIAVYPPWFISE